MKKHMVLGIGLVSAALAFTSVAAAQDNSNSELEMYKQRTDVLEKRVEQLEKAAHDQTTASDEQILKVAKRLAQENEKPTDFKVFWKDGLNFESVNKEFKLHIGGRLHLDSAWLGEDKETRNYVLPETGKPIGDQLDGFEVRRIRLQFDGTIYDNIFFKVEPDFAGSEKDKNDKYYGSSTVLLRDAFIGTKDLPYGTTIQAGHFKEPFSLEELTSDNYVTFIERALPNAFAPSYNAGIQLNNTLFKDRATWAIGVFRDTNDRGFSQSDGGYNVTARITAAPICSDDGSKLLHLGLSGSLRDIKSTLQYSSRPENHLASKYLDTNTMNADDAQLIGAEAAAVYGPASIQGEFMQATVDRTDATSQSFNGGYVQASYFLTGEHRVYKKSAGIFDRVRPITNFGKDADGKRGWGAWEAAARYSYLNLNGSDVKGGKLADTALGLNWYLNPNVRLMGDFTHAMLSNAKTSEGGDTNMFGLRFQIDF